MKRSIEFCLMVDCCRWSFRGADTSELLLPVGVDWHLLVQLARFHRVQGFVSSALATSDLPPSIAKELSSDARFIAASNLAKVQEYSRLKEAFSQAGMELLFLKGLTVSALAYRSPLLKLAWDVDVLIEPGDLGRAMRLLTERGFEAIIPQGADKVEKWHAREKESVWARTSDLMHIELHTRLADNRALIPSISIRSPRQEVEIAPGTRLPTLARDELFAYLAVHGASSAWFRLKWIADFAGCLQGLEGVEIERLYLRSQELGAGRAASQALLLADALFGTLAGAPNLRTFLAGDRSARLLSNTARRLLTRGTTDPTESFLGTWPIHWTQFLLLPGAAFKFSELVRQAATLNRAG